MSIEYQILGKPGRDNAAYIWLNAGSRMYRFLFDCGESIFAGLKQADIKSVDYLLFSHLHMDHIAGFDYYFRRNFDREQTNYIWGPENTSSILHNRLQGFAWNLVWQTPGKFLITDILNNSVSSSSFITSEAYKDKHNPAYPFEFDFSGSEITLMDNQHFILKAVILNHMIPSIAYNIREKDSLNISKEELEKTGLAAGSWLQYVRDLSVNDNTDIDVNGTLLNLGRLREKLLVQRKGESISYLTDFIYDDTAKHNAVKLIEGSDVVICESQYHNDDLELASRNYHLTSRQAAQLAADANIKKLLLFHISERYYTAKNYNRLLEDARTVFPETYYPDTWNK
jgi:ribonuclease Z